MLYRELQGSFDVKVLNVEEKWGLRGALVGRGFNRLNPPQSFPVPVSRLSDWAPALSWSSEEAQVKSSSSPASAVAL